MPVRGCPFRDAPLSVQSRFSPRHFVEAPASGQSICCLFDVRDFAPATVAEERMSKLMSDNVLRKFFGRFFQLWPQHNSPAPLSGRPRSWHKKAPPFARFVVVDIHAEPRIIKKVLLHIIGQGLQDFSDPPL